MTRVSLKETYDNRSVIAQIAKVTDTAEDAAETVEQKAAEINDAITEVNAAVQAAEGAVTTANAASASAQQSAQTVAGYNTRLTTAEGEIDTLQSDLNSVTLRVQTAEGNIVTIQGRVTALETADGQNIKLTGPHAIGNYAVLLTGEQTIAGPKTCLDDFTIQKGLPLFKTKWLTGNDTSPPPGSRDAGISFVGNDGVEVGSLYMRYYATGVTELRCKVRNADGTHTTNVITGGSS